MPHLESTARSGPSRPDDRISRGDRAKAEIIIKAEHLVIATSLPQGEEQRSAGTLTEHDMEHRIWNDGSQSYQSTALVRPERGQWIGWGGVVFASFRMHR